MKKKVKIRLKKGTILTIDISKKTEDQIFGTDKFGQDVILSVDEIASMIPITSSEVSK